MRSALGSPAVQLFCWRPETGSVERLQISCKLLSEFRLSADGHHFILAQRKPDWHVACWDLSTQSPKRLWTMIQPYQAIALSLDGKQMAVLETPSQGGLPPKQRLATLDIKTGERLQSIPTQEIMIDRIAFAGPNLLISRALGSPVLSLWRMEPQRIKPAVPMHQFPPLAVRFRADGQGIVSVSHQNGVAEGIAIASWDRLGRPASEWTIDRSISAITENQTLSLDGVRVAAMNGTTLVAMDTNTKKLVAELAELGKEGYQISLFAMSPDAARILLVTNNNLQLWERGAKHPIREWDAHGVNALSISPDGRWAAIAGGVEAPPVQVWDLTTDNERLFLNDDLVEQSAATAVAFSPDSQLLAVARQNRRLEV